jgi:LytS/YehU family sensor histidine kinase
VTVVTTQQYQRAVGIFVNYRTAEKALHVLSDSGFLMDQVSVIARNQDNVEPVAGTEISMIGNKADESAVAGAATGGTLGILTGLLVGMGIVVLPGVGPVLLGGMAATALATALSGGAIGAVAGGLLGGLIGLGIPEERAKIYSDRITRGEYMVMVEGTVAEIRQAEAILLQQGIQEWGVYDLPANYTIPSYQTDSFARP